MDLSPLTDFHAVAVYGGVSVAARATGTPKATLSRRIRGLETGLGVRLFERGARSARLTEERRELQARTAELADAAAEVTGRTGWPRGRLRVSVPGYFAQQSFARFAAAFVAADPEVVLDTVVQDRFIDPIADEFDVVIGSTLIPITRSSDSAC